MFRMKNIVLLVFLLIVVSVAVFAITKISQSVPVAEDITLEEVELCSTISWNETQYIYGNCTDQYYVTRCEDEPFNTSCYVEEITHEYICPKSTQLVERIEQKCSGKGIQITVDRLLSDDIYRLDYKEWGNCSYTPGNSSVVIICDSRLDGNADGICQAGESCIAFVVSKNSISRLFRNSRKDFVEYDETFRQDKLEMVTI